MRDIKFRAKDSHNNWIYGGYYKLYDIDMECYHHLIIDVGGCSHAVVESTICEYTGEVDTNGEEIYEHDLVDYFPLNSLNVYGCEVVYKDGAFKLKIDNYYVPLDPDFMTITGDVYDN